jgi:hypothetical protein
VIVKSEDVVLFPFGAENDLPTNTPVAAFLKIDLLSFYGNSVASFSLLVIH